MENDFKMTVELDRHFALIFEIAKSFQMTLLLQIQNANTQFDLSTERRPSEVVNEIAKMHFGINIC